MGGCFRFGEGEGPGEKGSRVEESWGEKFRQGGMGARSRSRRGPSAVGAAGGWKGTAHVRVGILAIRNETGSIELRREREGEGGG